MSTTITASQLRRHLVGIDSWLYAANQSGAFQPGLVTSSGTAVTGTNTLFTSSYLPGDTIVAGDQPIPIASIASDTSLTLSYAPAYPWTSIPHKKSIGYDDTYITTVLLPQAIRRFEMETNFHINQTQITSLPDGTYSPQIVQGALGAFGGVGGVLPSGGPSTWLPIGTPYLVEPAYAWWRNQLMEYGRISLKHRPVLGVQRYRVLWNSNFNVYTMDPTWIHSDFNSGEVYLIPYQGAATIGSAAIALSILAGSFATSDLVPGIVSVDYVCGLAANWQSDPQWGALQKALEECCAFCILEQISQALDPGLQGSSVNMPGFSQNLQWDRFMGRKAELQASYQSFGKTLEANQGGPIFASV